MFEEILKPSSVSQDLSLTLCSKGDGVEWTGGLVKLLKESV